MTKSVSKIKISAPAYLLEMGAPIKTNDLAQRMIQLSGLRILNKIRGNGDIEIQITGLRAGKKLHEELLIDKVSSDTIHSKIKLAKKAFIQWPKLKIGLLKIQNVKEINNKG